MRRRRRIIASIGTSDTSSKDLLAARVLDVEDRGILQRVRQPQGMATGRLVLCRPIQRARLVVAQRANRIEDIVQDIVVCNPAVLLRKAIREVIHAIRCAEGHFAARCIDQAAALARVGGLELHGNRAASDRLVGRRVAGVEVVPGVVADVVGAAGLVDAQQVDLAPAVGEGDADVVAGDALGPVGDAVGVDFAAEHADAGRVAVVRGGPDGAAGGCGCCGASEEEDRSVDHVSGAGKRERVVETREGRDGGGIKE